jgi:hypothetical protein
MLLARSHGLGWSRSKQVQMEAIFILSILIGFSVVVVMDASEKRRDFLQNEDL